MNTNTRRFKATALALAVLGTLASGQAAASGFQLREQSVKNLGKSNAGSIVGKDASNVALNPAAMTNLDKITVQSDLTVIDLSADFVGSGRILGSAHPAAGLSGGNGGDPGDPTVVPNMAAVFPLKGALEGATVGVSIGAPFGLKTEYEPGWVGRYRALTSDVKAVDLTLSAAIKPADSLSIGLGLIYEHAEATLSKAIDFGTAICAASGNPANCFNPAFPFKPQQMDGGFEVQGSSSSIGYVVGMQFQPSARFALGVLWGLTPCALVYGVLPVALLSGGAWQGGIMRGGPVSRILSTPDRDPGLDDHSSRPAVTGALKLPTRASRVEASLRAVSRTEIRDRPPREAPIRHCSRWGLPCRSRCRSRGGLLPHRFTLAAGGPAAVSFSVALSLGLPPPGVTRHPCLMESGLSSERSPVPRSSGHPRGPGNTPGAAARQLSAASFPA